MSGPARVFALTLSAGAGPRDALRVAASLAFGARRRELEGAAQVAERGGPVEALFPEGLGPPVLVELMRRAPDAARPRVAAHAAHALAPPRPTPWSRLSAEWFGGLDYLHWGVAIALSAASTLIVKSFVVPNFESLGLAPRPELFVLALASFGVAGVLLVGHGLLYVPRPPSRGAAAPVAPDASSLLYWLAAGADAGVPAAALLALIPRLADVAEAPDPLAELSEIGAIPGPLARIAARPLPGEAASVAFARAARLAARHPARRALTWPVLVAAALLVVGVGLVLSEVFRLLVGVSGAIP